MLQKTAKRGYSSLPELDLCGHLPVGPKELLLGVSNVDLISGWAGGLGGSGQGGALVDVSKPLHQGGTLQEEASFGVHSASYWLLPPSTCRVFHCVYTLPRMDELQSSG